MRRIPFSVAAVSALALIGIAAGLAGGCGTSSPAGGRVAAPAAPTDPRYPAAQRLAFPRIKDRVWPGAQSGR